MMDITLLSRSLLSVWLVMLLYAGAAESAELRLAEGFSAGAVLQAGVVVPVWGWAEPGQTVRVEFAGKNAEGVADAEGRWLVRLSPLQGSAVPADLRVTAGKQTRTAENILVGDVWVCSGQSNMAFELKKAKNAQEEIAQAEYPQIRMFTVANKVAGQPQEHVNGAWKVCTPANAPDFSAVSYFFARELFRQYRRPIGLIHASCGWTPSEAWTPREALLENPETEYIVKRWDWVCDADVQAATQELLKVWKQQNDVLKRKGKSSLPRPHGGGDPQFAHRASGLWNGMIAPWLPYAIRGVIWYQGETNEWRGYRYRIEFPLLIESWRKAWGRPDLPFCFVQVANVLPVDPVPVPSEWAELRESQTLALKLPNTAMAVTIDIGEANEVHPKNKQDVGKRLALAARAVAYGEAVIHSGPVFRKIQFQTDRALLSFDCAAGLITSDREAPQAFTIAGADQRFYPARARIVGEQVEVWSDNVHEPKAVRYAWANNPGLCNLYNGSRLPAVPFRTDDWPAKTQDARGLVIDEIWR